MENNQAAILNHLKEFGVGIKTNLSPLLMNMYPDINVYDYDQVITAVAGVNALMESMENSDLISYDRFKIGQGNTSSGMTWLDTVNVMAAITTIGNNAINNYFLPNVLPSINEENAIQHTPKTKLSLIDKTLQRIYWIVSIIIGVFAVYKLLNALF